MRELEGWPALDLTGLLQVRWLCDGMLDEAMMDPVWSGRGFVS